MDEIINTLVNELAKRVLAKINEDTTNMREFLKLKIKAEDIEGLESIIDDKFNDTRDSVISDAEDAAKQLLERVSISVDY